MSHHFSQLGLREQVQRARELAAGAIITGLSGYAEPQDNNPDQMIRALAGCQEWVDTYLSTQDSDFQMIIADLVAAAHALGIAEGLLLRPELFSDHAVTRPDPR